MSDGNPITAQSLPLADCPQRTTSASGELLCQLAAKFASLDVSQCKVGADACRVCMSRTIPATTPNDVVASMALAASRIHSPEKTPALIHEMRPFLAAAQPGGRVPPKQFTIDELPCAHRGDLIRKQECKPCQAMGATALDVFSCSKHTECTVNNTAVQPRIKGCSTCGDRTALVQIAPLENIGQGKGVTKPTEIPGIVSVVSITEKRPKPQLSIVMATYDDWDGVYFTVQILRSFFREILEETNAEIICVDTNPQSPDGKECRNFFTHWVSGGRDGDRLLGDTTQGVYIDGGHLQGTAAPRDLAIRKARGEIILCVDCHVIPQPGSLQALVKYFRDNPESIDLIHGPLLMDNFRPLATRMNPIWGEDKMFGKWGYDPSDAGPDGRYRTDLLPFEIPMHGLGLFACRKTAWQGFNPKFTGFGGEEGYIHEKFRLAGGKVICLPELQWLHRFGRPGGAGYRNDLTDRMRNYVFGRTEIGGDVHEVLQQFAGRIPEQAIGQMMVEVARAG